MLPHAFVFVWSPQLLAGAYSEAEQKNIAATNKVYTELEQQAADREELRRSDESKSTIQINTEHRAHTDATTE